MAQKKKTSSTRKAQFAKAGDKRRKPENPNSNQHRTGKGSKKRNSYPGSPLVWLA